MECGSSDRVKIRNNEFHDTVRLKHKGASAITIGAPIKVNGVLSQSTGIVHRHIAVSDNAFIDTGGSAIAADAVEDLIIDGNNMERCADTAVALGAVRRVSLTGNRCAPRGTVAIPARYRGELSAADNSGLAIKARR
jgi:hypothetical protein